jgi:hypothetical protein
MFTGNGKLFSTNVALLSRGKKGTEKWMIHKRLLILLFIARVCTHSERQNWIF